MEGSHTALVSFLRGNAEMTSALNTLLLIRSRGARLWVENDALKFEAPKGAILPEDIQQLRRFKGEIVELMSRDASANSIPLGSRSALDDVPLTPLQQREWDSICERGDSYPRRHVFAVRVLGELKIQRLCEALDLVRSRHEILRTRFFSLGGSLGQFVEPVSSSHVSVIDLSTAGLQAAEVTLERELVEFAEARANPCQGPIFDARLWRIGERVYVFAVSLDKMISDCNSNEIVCREVWAAYAQAVRGETLSQGRAEIQFADYAVWLLKVHPVWMSTHAQFWQRRFADVTLPKSSPTHPSISGNRASVAIPIDADLAEQLLPFARERQVFPALIMLAAYMAAVHRCFGRRDIIVMITDNGRFRLELENMVGWLVNNLFLRVSVCGNDTFQELLSNVGKELANAHHHRDFNWVPALLPHLISDLHFNWVTSRRVDANVCTEDLRSVGIELRSIDLRRSTSVADFEISFRHDAGLIGLLDYSRDSPFAPKVEEFVADLISTLRQLILRPTMTLGRHFESRDTLG